MCGIAGYVQPNDARAPLAAMLQALAHRGPDGSGTWFGRTGDYHLALGHRRLAIIDLAGGAQPMGNEDGQVQLTFNGEIYNFQDLRPGLVTGGHRFATRSDTEVIIHHWEATGAAGLPALNGMFAFALWDARRGELVLARDRAGVKPLYYAPLPGGGLVFASELAALLQHPAVPHTVAPAGLADYFLVDYAQPPTTLVAGVCKLPPGHYLVWRAGKLTGPQPFWRLADTAPRAAPLPPDATLAAELWQRLGAAVERQLIADVPVGVFLSGGLDSSSIACLARARVGTRLQSFSIGFTDPAFDESPYARQVATLLGTDHHEERLGPEALAAALDEVLARPDEPFADPSILPTYLLARLAARHVKVALSGDGGDELWAGYPTYQAHCRHARVYGLLPGALRRGLIAPLVRRLPVRHGYMTWEFKAKRFALRWDDDPVRRHLRWMAGVDLPELTAAVPGAGAAPPAVLACDPLARGGDPLNRLLALDFSTYLPGSVLTKVDRATMAHGLEARPPFLDNEVVAWAFGLPGRLKLRGGTTKYLLKLAARDHLPVIIRQRRKQGFAMPLAAWLRGPLQPRVAAVLRDSPVWDGGLLARDVFAGWLADHTAWRMDRAKPLWALLVLDQWARRQRIRFAAG